MKRILFITSFVLSTLLIQAQDFEICRFNDSLSITNAIHPTSLYEIAEDSCLQFLNETECAQNSSSCVWELGESCVTRAQQQSLNLCFQLPEEDCIELIDYGCEWNGNNCLKNDSIIQSFRQTINVDTFVLAPTNKKYILRDNLNQLIGFIAEDVVTCSFVTNVSDINYNNISVFPNPITNQKLYITLKKSYTNVSITVFDSLGKTISNSSNFSGNEIVINADFWPKGYYQVVLNLDGKIQAHTVIK